MPWTMGGMLTGLIVIGCLIIGFYVGYKIGQRSTDVLIVDTMLGFKGVPSRTICERCGAYAPGRRA